VIEVDRRKVGNGRVGPITSRLQSLFFDAIRGRNPRYASWVHAVKPVGVAAAAKA
jgi:branched-chain amino acid aminotransferase